MIIQKKPGRISVRFVLAKCITLVFLELQSVWCAWMPVAQWWINKGDFTLW